MRKNSGSVSLSKSMWMKSSQTLATRLCGYEKDVVSAGTGQGFRGIQHTYATPPHSHSQSVNKISPCLMVCDVYKAPCKDKESMATWRMAPSNMRFI